MIKYIMLELINGIANINNMNIVILGCIMMSIIVYMYLGYTSKIDKSVYRQTIGMIIKRTYERQQQSILKGKMNGINVFTNKTKYYIDIDVKYYINNKRYTSSFCINNDNVNYTKNQITKEWRKYAEGTLLDIYYDKNNPTDSYLDFDVAIKNVSKYYYSYACLMLSVLFIYVGYLYLGSLL